MRSFLGRDILSLKDFERHEFEHVFEVADRFEAQARERRNSDLLAHKSLVTAFSQTSTRTRLATAAAMHRLGGHVLGFADAKMTRAGDFYQESIKDADASYLCRSGGQTPTVLCCSGAFWRADGRVGGSRGQGGAPVGERP